MTPELLILIVLGMPLLTAVSIFILRSIPDLREGATLVGATGLFASVIWLVSTMADGAPVEAVLGQAAPGLIFAFKLEPIGACLLYTSPSPRDKRQSRMPSSA